MFLLGVWICVLWVGSCVVFRGVEVVCLPHAVSLSLFHCVDEGGGKHTLLF